MLSGGDVRVCIAHSETDNEVENIEMDALETIKSLHLARSSVLHESMRSSVVVAQAAAPQTDCTQAVAGGNDEVGKTVDGHCGRQ